MWPKFYLTNFLFSCINSGVKPTMQDLNLYYSIQFFNLCIFFHILKFFVKFLNRVIYYEAISYFDYITPVYGDPSIAFFIFQLLFVHNALLIHLIIFYFKLNILLQTLWETTKTKWTRMTFSPRFNFASAREMGALSFKNHLSSLSGTGMILNWSTVSWHPCWMPVHT